MHKMGGLRQLGVDHSGSAALSPFDRARTTSYSTLIETMRLSCTVFEIFTGYLPGAAAPGIDVPS